MFKSENLDDQDGLDPIIKQKIENGEELTMEEIQKYKEIYFAKRSQEKQFFDIETQTDFVEIVENSDVERIANRQNLKEETNNGEIIKENTTVNKSFNQIGNFNIQPKKISFESVKELDKLEDQEKNTKTEVLRKDVKVLLEKYSQTDLIEEINDFDMVEMEKMLDLEELEEDSQNEIEDEIEGEIEDETLENQEDIDEKSSNSSNSS